MMKLIAPFVFTTLFFVATFAAPTLPEETPKEVINNFPIAPNDTETDSILAEDLSPKVIPDPIDEKIEDKKNEMIQRMKKSATTTFCVEVKPNNPYQKPYELCESGNEIYAVPSDSNGHYPSAAPSPSVPVYGPPPKTYGAPVAPSNGYVQSAPTSGSYKTATKTYETKKYRANEENELEDSNEEEEFHDGMRSSYGSGYGYGGNVYETGAIKKHKKHGHGHSGVVITCQPNLAGYASPVAAGNIGGGYGSGYGYGSGHGYAGSYRNSNPSTDGNNSQMKSMDDPRLGRSYSYGNRNPSYGNNGYGPIPSRPNSYSSASATSFVAPQPIPSYSSVPHQVPNLISPQIPLSGQYPVPSPSYPSPSYPSHLSPSYPSPSYQSPSYQSPSFQQTFPAPATYSAPVPVPSYGNSGSSAVGYGGYKGPQQQQPQKGGSFSSATAYVAPGTYRSTDGESKMENMENKDMMMMKKMEDDHHWNQEMRSDADQQQKETITNEEKKM